MWTPQKLPYLKCRVWQVFVFLNKIISMTLIVRLNPLVPRPYAGLTLVLVRPRKKHTNAVPKEAFTKERDESALSKWYSDSQYNGRHPRK
jgi:hypothetical protein